MDKNKQANYAYNIPATLNNGDIGTKDVPSIWNSRSQFVNDPTAKDLNRFLATPQVLQWQSEFAVQRGFESAYKILAANTLDTRSDKISNEKLCAHFKKLFSSPGGITAVVDYTNFKGEGLHPAEMNGTDHVRWGLKQVIEGMDSETLTPTQAAQVRQISDAKDRDAFVERQKFANSAKKALENRVKSYVGLQQQAMARNIPGWGQRIDRTYAGNGITPDQCPLLANLPINNNPGPVAVGR